jgi:hypothetical protein
MEQSFPIRSCPKRIFELHFSSVRKGRKQHEKSILKRDQQNVTNNETSYKVQTVAVDVPIEFYFRPACQITF